MAAPADLGGGAAALLLLRGLIGELQRDDLVLNVGSVVQDGVAYDGSNNVSRSASSSVVHAMHEHAKLPSVTDAVHTRSCRCRSRGSWAPT